MHIKTYGLISEHYLLHESTITNAPCLKNLVDSKCSSYRLMFPGKVGGVISVG
jgi:hypothetical protein